MVDDLPKAMTPRTKDADRTELLQGPLDMLILRTLLLGPLHGQGIANTIEHTSDNVLQIDHGSLYPALQRLQMRGLITAKWGTSETNRRAKYYRLTPAGKRQLHTEISKWERLTAAIVRIVRPAEGKTS